MWSVRLEEYFVLEWSVRKIISLPNSPPDLLLQFGADVFSSGRVRLSGQSVLHQVDTKEESPSSHVSNDLWDYWDRWSRDQLTIHLIFLSQLSGSLQQDVADVVSVLDQLLVLDHVQHGRGDGAADWISFIIIRVNKAGDNLWRVLRKEA